MTTLTANTNSFTHPTTALSDARGTLLSKIKDLVALLATAIDVYSERRHMLTLTDQELSDIGITREQIKKESKRSFFDIPAR